MLIPAVRNARVAGSGDLVDILIDSGRISAITSALGRPGPGLDAGGRGVLPGLVDAHVHLDKAYQLDSLNELGEPLGTLGEAIAATKALRRRLTLDQVAASARRLLARMVRHGTTAARVHVEIDGVHGLDAVRWHRNLAAEWADRIALQLVAFPQNGLFQDPEVPEIMDAALQEGCDVVGACPYADPDPVAHVDHVVELATRHGRALDVHIDFSSDPEVNDLDTLVGRLDRAGRLAPPTAVGHATSLAFVDPAQVQARAARLAALGVGVIALPLTDLFLVGATAPVQALDAAGVTVAIGTNNVCNAFTPYGDGSLLHAASVAGVANRLGSGAGHRLLLDAVTSSPARLLGLADHGLRPGSWADVVVIDDDRPELAAATMADVLATVHRGRISYGPARSLQLRPP